MAPAFAPAQSRPRRCFTSIANHMEFITQNLVWIALAVVSAALLIAPLMRAGGKDNITVTQAVMLINREDAQVIDVRAAAEFAKGHFPSARNIELGELDKHIDELGKLRKRPLIIVCQSGMRGASAGEKLRKAGFEKVYNLEGGIAAWSQAGQPLVSGT